MSIPERASPNEDSTAKSPPKIKYTCPVCGANAWANPDTVLYCGASRHLQQMRADGESVAELARDYECEASEIQTVIEYERALPKAA